MWLLWIGCELRFSGPVAVPLLGSCPSAEDAVPLFEDQDGDERGGGVARQGCPPVAGWATLDGDCDDTDPWVYTGAPEQCNERDDDCDLVVDEAPDVLWCADFDVDGFGDPGDGVRRCDPPSSYVLDCTDCDDGVAGTNPDAAEVPGDKVDNDCDEQIDEVP